MKIGKRNFLILQEIIKNRDNITGKELESRFHLSRKQLSYGLLKINEYLSDCGYPEITRSASGRINVPSQVIFGVDLKELEKENEEIDLSKEERIDFLYLMLLGNQEELSLQHFISELKVSKNTVLADLKKLDEMLRQNRLALSYGRQDGYTLNGSEYAKRQFLMGALSNIIIQYGHTYVIRDICRLSQEDVDVVRGMLEGIEEELDICFAGAMMETAVYFFTILFCRIRENRVLEEIPEDLRFVKGTKEYGVISKFAADYQIANEYEVMYITAYIQGMKREFPHWVRDAVDEYHLHAVVREIIEKYEKQAYINIRNKEELEGLLLQHCESAMYRIRYEFHIGLDIAEYVLPMYQETHELVKKSVEPLEVLVGKRIPEKELVYITLIIATYAAKDGSAAEDMRPVAIVVCQNGITVSRMILSLLKRLFPEIEFTQCMSAGQFRDYQGFYDLVFSTVPLDAGRRVFVIDPLMNERQQRALREKVFKDPWYRISSNALGDGLLKVEKEYMGEFMRKPRMKEEDFHLRDLLTEKNIRIVKEILGWREAIELAAMPLLYQHIIEIRYVETILSNIEKDKPCLTIASGVIIAHAGIGDGVRALGVSVLALPEEISIAGYLDAKVIVVLATPDTRKHLTALNDLVEILEDEEKLRQLKTAKSPEDILSLL